MSTLKAVPTSSAAQPEAIVADLVARGRVAMAALEGAGQEQIDEAVTALAWSIYKPENARLLAEMAVADTGLGNVPDKITKNTAPCATSFVCAAPG
jgi:sulfoacetaldehyde dehydrogenase